ncbi:glycosyltransferase family 2 protein [Citrobacter braakii]|uniref:glycosyltransferase family 2 protein n=2 Tax=Citrobacter braakii TaxID=57706 RepID=UPI00227E53EB|nr:glycosyltransferase family 2 protein [Citrobacter braakii]MCY9797020.1 glycosyltransferase family 2 protein [Citrobacter braakii]MDL4385184.1 glycosyltransferase family 2 protein [Citrobacter braakii]
MQKDKVSIIMPCFNSGKTVIKSVQSVLNQSYQNFELIICDDNSTDNTMTLLREIKDSRIVITKNSYRKGASGARNTALDLCSGYFIAFLDSDDFWHKDKLMQQITFMKDNTCEFSYSNYYVVKEDRVIGTFYARETIGYNELLKKCDIGCLTVIITSRLLGLERFPEGGKEDYRLWLNILSKDEKMSARNCNAIHAYYSLSPFSLSGNKLKEVYRQWSVIDDQMISFERKLYCMLIYAVSGLCKHFIKYRSGKNEI